jgi:hypothetical protein
MRVFKSRWAPALFLVLALCTASARAAQLTDMEIKWIAGAKSVLAYARAIALPVDIVVQPQAGPGDVPFAMGFNEGRCKLVLSMRGNPQAERVLADVPAERQALLIEAIAAHEMGHCWRHARGAWHTLPDGKTEARTVMADRVLQAEMDALRADRREEGYSDLVALAWVKRHHPGNYAEVQGWLEQMRSPAGDAHDTGAWVKLARDREALALTATPFEDAAALWSKGLADAH